MNSTVDLSFELARLRDTHEAAAGQPLVEDFGDVVDRREYLTDDPACGFPLLNPFSVHSDREAGKLWPIYQCEQDLARIRGRSHNLATLTATAAGVLDALANYVLGPGFTFTARAADGQAHDLAAAVQGTIDRFLDDNAFCGGLDREAHSRSREDGEAFLLLCPRPNGAVRARFLECEQITEPADPRPLEDWLACGEEFPSCWKFGVHTPARETDQVLGYHVVYDGAGLDWDYVPAARMVAESPFVKAREADQQFYKRHFGSLLWKVVRLAWEAGRFARLGVSWETLEALIDIKIDAPAVATRDALEMARTQEVQIGLGLLSRRTAAAQAGLDYDAEVAQGAAAKPQATSDVARDHHKSITAGQLSRP